MGGLFHQGLGQDVGGQAVRNIDEVTQVVARAVHMM